MAHRIALRGCSPEPMAAYLKALGVLRLVSEQEDQEARAWWRGDTFWLESSLDEDGLVRFFLDRYSPTPIVGPWNGGSGFYEGDSKVGLERILATDCPRFREYSQTIKTVLSLPELPPRELSIGSLLQQVELEAAKSAAKKLKKLLELLSEAKAELPDASERTLNLTVDELAAEGVRVRALKKVRTAVNSANRASSKEAIIRSCRNRLCDRALDWIDAAAIVGPDNKLYPPPVLGTGGNEGNLDYTNGFMDRVSGLLLDSGDGRVKNLLRNALFGEATGGLEVAATGQHDPGRAGGYNQGPGIETKKFPANPWEFVLSMEGAAAWASGVSRRQGVGTAHGASSSFTVRPRTVGYGSASENDDSRAEIWMPIWERAAEFEELRSLLREGRADIGRRQASDGVQFAEAVASLGVDRGITSFVRFSLLKRRGDSYVALPAARFQVRERREVDLIEELDPILAQVDGFGRAAAKGNQAAPARFVSCRRGVDRAIYSFLVQGDAVRFKDLLAAIGRMEKYFAARDPGKEPHLSRPLSGLSARWVLAADDGSVEVRIAAALASIGPTEKVGPLRAGLISVDPEKHWAWAEGNGQKSWSGATFAERLTGVLQRRMMDAERLACDAKPLRGSIEVHPRDIAAFLEGSLDDELIEDLLFGMTWIEWWKADAEAAELRRRWSEPVARSTIPRSWALLKQLFRNDEVRRRTDGVEPVGYEPAVIPLLRAQRVGDACRLVARRLHSKGLKATRAVFPDGEDGMRLAASLLVPSRKLQEISTLVLEQDEETGA
jgi:CRISPR-associated protein Csx17